MGKHDWTRLNTKYHNAWIFHYHSEELLWCLSFECCGVLSNSSNLMLYWKTVYPTYRPTKSDLLNPYWGVLWTLPCSKHIIYLLATHSFASGDAIAQYSFTWSVFHLTEMCKKISVIRRIDHSLLREVHIRMAICRSQTKNSDVWVRKHRILFMK